MDILLKSFLNHIWLTILILLIILLVVRIYHIYIASFFNLMFIFFNLVCGNRSLFKSPSQKRFSKNLMRQVPYLFARYFT